jgi:two-component system NtrC family response regulator
MSDLLLLVKHFIEQKQQNVPEGMRLITDDAIEIMQAYSWPGNVRELANCVEHAMVLCDELPIRLEHLPFRIQSAERKVSQVNTGSGSGGTHAAEPAIHEKTGASNAPQSLKQIEMQAILDGLGRNNGNKSRTAEQLGISLKTLYNKLNQIESTETNPEAACFSD